MLVPINWLKEYVDIDVPTEEFSERMIMSGSNIETVKRYGDFEKVVMGKVLSVRPHEDSDHLVVCALDVGAGEALQIVTGASNVAEGMFVPVALEGSVLPGGLKIKKGRLRGVDSYGMICSASELGFEDKVIPVSHRDGIWPVEGEYATGSECGEAMGIRDEVADFEITPNRPDCLSVIGMAREAAAVFGGKLRYPDSKVRQGHEKKASDFIDVEIKDPKLCSRYIARVATDVKIKQSPFWMQRKLMLAGMRPINNIVDITNYVLLEYGHPLHAFDIRTIEGGKIIVDVAGEGQRFVTLDGNERVLGKDALMINDASKPVGIAGVMGGMNSEIQDDTDTILIECACFDSDCIRLTSKRLGLRTEASSRYEKGIDPTLSEEAVNRVCALIELLGAGRVAEGAVDVYPARGERRPIALRTSRLNKVLGTSLTTAEAEGYLARLEMKAARADKDGEEILEVLPPAVRLDLKEEVDLIEEVARIHGFDKLPTTIPRGDSQAGVPAARALRDAARDALTAMGFNEIQTYSFVSPKGADAVRTAKDARERDFVRLINPLGEDNSVMRTALLPNLLETLGRNYSRQLPRAFCFEIGNTFAKGVGELPEERTALAIGGYGGLGFHDLKGVLEELLALLGLKGDFDADSESGTYHPGRCAKVSVAGEAVGRMGEIHPDVAETFGIEGRCCAGEFDLEKLTEKAEVLRTYRPLPKYPSVDRDIALLVGEGQTAKSLESVIKGAGGKLLESARLFDVYRGKQVAEGMKSVAFSLVYRSAEKTLREEEVAVVHAKVLKALKEKTGAELRDA
ncbi:MAG: phenylalanine--tRNA ligase subunit beta [Clostridiales Family XIII bacterium]|jgi:phenylalanyl-tRNA synthetase beta chain|nr:phenylalanine--tRNA ligase subunit beta [Clostridiales Family XIII bacterium]